MLVAEASASWLQCRTIYPIGDRLLRACAVHDCNQQKCFTQILICVASDILLGKRG